MSETFPEPHLKRLGVFSQPGYVTIDEPYMVRRESSMFRTKPNKGVKPLILPGGYSKQRSGGDDGYFSPFARILDGEAISNIITLRRQWQKEINEKKLGKQWVPSSPAKRAVGTGSPAGNFTEFYPALSTEMRKVIKEKELHNFYTNPGKKGTGYGYVDVTINPYPEWSFDGRKDTITADSVTRATEEHKNLILRRNVFVSQQACGGLFDPELINGVNPLVPGGAPNTKFGVDAFPKAMCIGPTFVPSHPAKWDGGCKEGALNKWPEHSNEPYSDEYRRIIDYYKSDPSDALRKKWIPQPPTAVEMPCMSIINRNVDLAITTKSRKKRLFVSSMCKK